MKSMTEYRTLFNEKLDKTDNFDEAFTKAIWVAYSDGAELTKAHPQWIDCSVELPKHGAKIVGVNSVGKAWFETFNDDEPLGNMVCWIPLPPNAQQERN